MTYITPTFTELSFKGLSAAEPLRSVNNLGIIILIAIGLLVLIIAATKVYNALFSTIKQPSNQQEA